MSFLAQGRYSYVSITRPGRLSYNSFEIEQNSTFNRDFLGFPKTLFSKNSTFNRNVLKFLQTGRLIEQYA